MTPDTTLILSVITRKFMASSSVFPMHVPPIKTPSSSLMSMVSASEFMIESPGEAQPGYTLALSTHNQLRRGTRQKQVWWKHKKKVETCILLHQLSANSVMIESGRTAATTALSLKRIWSYCYSRLKLVIGDKAKPITSQNPQANAICERVHLKILNIIRARPDLSDQLELAYARTLFVQVTTRSDVLRRHNLFLEKIGSLDSVHYAICTVLSEQRFAVIMRENARENEKRNRTSTSMEIKVPARDRRIVEEVVKGSRLSAIAQSSWTPERRGCD
ncbi:hypothetical protein PF005_g3726 [Phytophthora fragariae]|uniref:Uncharacterized protein n=1 Tax=Phytophthora fragariae TaxID=53985 RepID=A0A6A3Z602_9STRA|nr:hypothetical protein PF005_g3726 [Phytophthora fragariae]